MKQNPPDLFPGFETRRFTTGAAEIHARIGGDGPPLFLLHGYPQSHVMWHRIAPRLAERFRLIICDLRGYGASSIPARDAEHFSYSKRAMAEDVIDIADQLGLATFQLCGHDRGGRAGYRLALDHPARIEKLALLDIVPTYDMWHCLTRDLAMKIFHWPFLAQPAPWPEEIIGRAPVEWLEHKLGLWGGSGDLSVFAPEALDHYRAFFSEPARIHATCEDYRAGATCDLAADEADRAAGRRIACPTAILWGEQGIPSKTAGPLEIWQEWCVNVTGHAIASGHFLAEENPGETADALLKFFAGESQHDTSGE
jgi:haloacetate dehalogenase